MHAALRRLGAGLASVLLAGTAFAAPAHADPASLSGTVTAAESGAPLMACVTVYTSATEHRGSDCTDDQGHWVVDGLTAGLSYRVEVTPLDDVHVLEWAQDASTIEGSSPVTAPATVDVDLTLGGRLAGTLLRADGEPAVNADVSVISSAWRRAGGVKTDFMGTWTVANLPVGTYKVSFEDWPAGQWAFGADSDAEATPIEVTAGLTTQVDDRFRAGGTFSGSITSDLDGSPVEGACVSVMAAPIEPWSWPQGESCTGADGRYSVTVSGDGDYTAEITDPSGTYVAEYFGDTRDATRPASYKLAAGSTQTVDVALAPASAITGLAVDAKLGTPIRDVCPDAYEGRDGGSVRGQHVTCSGDDGRWTVRGLPAGSFTLHLAPQGTAQHAATWAFRAETQAAAELVTVGAGQVESVRNVKLDPGGTLSGVITDPAGRPVAGAWVNADGNYPGRAGPGEGPLSVQTDQNGRYTMVGLPPGDYRPIVYFYDGDLAPEWSGDANTKGSATPIGVKALKTATFDAQLAFGARITPEVLNAAGTPSDQPWMGFISTTSGDYIGDFEIWNGQISPSNALPHGEFHVRIIDPVAFDEFWYDGARSIEEASVVSLAPGEQRTLTFHVP